MIGAIATPLLVIYDQGLKLMSSCQLPSHPQPPGYGYPGHFQTSASYSHCIGITSAVG